MSDSYTFLTVVPADHASLNGHFPGNPVVPGVVILERIAETLYHWKPAAEIVGFPAVKFLQPLKPEEALEIRLQQNEGGKYRFECETSGQLIASGSFTCSDIIAIP